MSPIEEARSRRLDAVLTEAVRHDVPSDLEARIVAAVSAPRAARATSRWLVAAALLFGCGCVFATASLQQGGAAKAQDPKAVFVTTADVHASIVAIEAPAADEVQARLLQLAKDNEADLAIAAGVKGRSQVDVSRMSLQAAVRAIAQEVAAPVAEYDGILTVGAGMMRDAAKDRVTLHTDEISLRAFFKLLHARTGVGFVVGDDVTARLKVGVDDVAWRDLLDVVAKRCGFSVVGHGSVFAITKRQRDAAPRVFFAFEDESMARIVTTCSKIAGLNTILDAGVQGRLTLRVRNAGAREVVRVASACCGADVDAGTLVRITPQKAGARTVSMTAESCELATEVRRWSQALPGAKVDCASKASLAVFVHRADVRELLRAAAIATGHRLKVDDGTFAIR